LNKSNVDVLAPSLRFQGFNKNWIKGPLGPLTIKVGSGVTPRGGSSVYTPTGVLFIRSQNVKNDQLDLSDPTFIPPSVHSVMSGSRVQPKDVLLNITGASIGRSCVVPGRVQEANVNQHVCILRLEDVLDPNFLQSFLSSWRGQKLVYQSQAGGGREGLNFENIRTFIFNIPELPEQQKIAAFLSAVDTKSQQLQRKKELLEQYKKGVMQKIFSQEIRFKDEDGNDYPDWEEKRLGEFTVITKGKGIAKIEVEEDGVTECIRYGELYTTYSEVISIVKSRTNVELSTLILSQVNDVIIPSSGETHIDLATASYVPRGGIALGGDINIIKSDQDGIFMAYCLNNEKKHEIARLAQGSSVIHLYPNHLKELSVILPCLVEQKRISDLLSMVDKKIAYIELGITKIMDFKKGLLQQMFI